MDSNFLVNKKKLIKIIIVVAGELCCSGGAMEEVAICVLLDVRSEFLRRIWDWINLDFQHGPWHLCQGETGSNKDINNPKYVSQ